MTALNSEQDPIRNNMEDSRHDGSEANVASELNPFEVTKSENSPKVGKIATRERRRLISEEKQEAERIFNEKLRKARIKYKGCQELPDDLDNDVREAMEEDMRRKRLDYQRKRRQAMSDEMKQKDREYKRRYMRKRLDAMTEEQNRQRLLRRAELRRLKFENMTEEEKEAQREAKRLRQKRRLERMSQEEREEKNARRRLVAQQFRSTWDEEEKERRAIKRRMIKKRWVDNMTEEQRQAYFERRSQVNKRYRQRLATERGKGSVEASSDAQSNKTDTGNAARTSNESSSANLPDGSENNSEKPDAVFAVV